MAEAKQDQDTKTKEVVAKTDGNDDGSIKVTQDNLADIIQLLEPMVARWNQFGHLLRINPDTIETISKKPNTAEPRDKMTTLLKELKKNSELKWEDIVKAVERLRNNALASKLPQTGKVEYTKEEFVEKMLEDLEEVVPKWKRFGLFMHVPNAKLESIDSDKLTPYDCFDELMNEWMSQKGDKATTAELERACRSIRDNTLADKIKHWPDGQEETDIN